MIQSYVAERFGAVEVMEPFESPKFRFSVREDLVGRAWCGWGGEGVGGRQHP